MKRARLLAAAATVLLVAAASGCGGETESSSTEAPVVATGETADVKAIDNTFRPEEITVEAGTEVIWTNDGRNEHNIVPSDGSTDWGAETADFLPKDTYSHVFTTPGTYAYYCSIHGTPTAGMIGTIVVTG